MKPGEYIDLEVPATITPEWLEINMENAELSNWAEIILTLADGTRTTVKAKTVNNRIYIKKEALPSTPISSVRLLHNGGTTKEVKLTLFRMGLPADQADINPDAVTDSDLTTFFNNGKSNMMFSLPLPPNTSHIIVVGTAECTVNGTDPIEKDSHCQKFITPPTGKRVYLTAPQQEGKYTYEVIFEHKK